MSIVIVMGFLRVREGDIHRMRAAIVALTAAVREQDGCEHYSMAIDLDDPDKIIVSERWRDRAAQNAHMIGDHMADFNQAMRHAKIVQAAVNAYDGDGGIRKLIYI